MPSIDRVVRNIYYKRIGEDDKAVTAIKDVWNIGSANSLKFDLEKDTYGKALGLTGDEKSEDEKINIFEFDNKQQQQILYRNLLLKYKNTPMKLISLYVDKIFLWDESKLNELLILIGKENR